MKKRNKIFLLSPMACLTSCIGANWQVDVDRAKYVAHGIESAQSADTFTLPHYHRRLYYSSSSFTLEDRVTYSGSTENRRVTSTYKFNSVLLDLNQYTFHYIDTESSKTEGIAASVNKTTEYWFYIKDNVLVKAVDTGAAGGAGAYYTHADLNDEDVNVSAFLAYISELFDIEDKSVYDYRGGEFLDIVASIEEVDEYNKIAGVDSKLKFYSRRDGTLSKEITTQLKDVPNEVLNCVETGVVYECYGWQDNFYTSYAYNSLLDQTKDKNTLVHLTHNESKETIFNPVNTVKPDSPAYKTEYDFVYPDLSLFNDYTNKE